MLGQSKLQKERNQKLLLELLALPGNNICADCKARNPRWASHNIGIFICMHCASIHRKIGTHITKVKSITMDDWTREQVETMKSYGNIKSNAIYNPNELRYPPPPNLEESERDSDLEQYIRSKYQYRRFLDKSALVASKLGPSKSVSSVGSSIPTPPPQTERNKSPRPTTDQALTATGVASSIVIPSRQPIVSPAHAALAKANAPDCPLWLKNKSTTDPSSNAKPPSSVWNDLSSLSNLGQDSSLPLQFQTPGSMGQSPMQHLPTGLMNFPVGMTPTGIGMNSFQPQMHASSQQPMLPTFGPTISTTPMMAFQNNTPLQQQFGQPWAAAAASQAPLMIQSTTQTSFYQPQPQLSIQHTHLTPSPGLSSSRQSFSAPVTQTQFLTPSPSQHLQQLQALQSTMPHQSSGFILPTPSPQISMDLRSHNTGMGMAQPSFLGTTTMQMMQQQQLLQQQQQQQQQQQAMFAAAQMQPMTLGGGGMYTQGSQWGSL